MQIPNTKFQENLPGGGQSGTCGRTDRHDENTSLFAILRMSNNASEILEMHTKFFVGISEMKTPYGSFREVCG